MSESGWSWIGVKESNIVTELDRGTAIADPQVFSQGADTQALTRHFVWWLDQLSTDVAGPLRTQPD